ncbi:hypothetical protein GALMADRAFT_148747 [Galerina marginata CBS 339.88]|uniref:Catalase n=1 Tax=Galerina marginata (strain CBS 339.88) TaxID=685588 RepID=A0A067SF42_GALM3|nr:hypothetical protein GALMADRAFT_148747 [Galerina marginata CBS 339.88]
MALPNPDSPLVYTTSNGAPVSVPYAAQRAGINGPLLLQDFHHLDLLAHFDHERIPERVVHAKGAGAHGYFEVTHDWSAITSQPLLGPGKKKVDVTVRFSTVGGESGSADTARDPRGFAVKLKTDEGNWDWVFNNTPVFFIRDPAKFPHFIHTQKRNPQSHLKDPDMFWDYLSLNPESIHQVMILFSDGGTPDGFHNMNGYSGHTYKWLKKDGTFVYTQLKLSADGGCKNLNVEEATRLAGENPDYGTETLFKAIEAGSLTGNFPSWTVSVQTMTVEEAEAFEYNILDLTKIWPEDKYPPRPVGKLVLNRNPKNYFAEIEQAAFSPSHTIPYIEPSADPVLQARLFSYPDTHRHRLGVNCQQLPVNLPKASVVNFQRDGPATFISQDSRPNYQSSIDPLDYKGREATLEYGVRDKERFKQHEAYIGGAWRDLAELTELDFKQPCDMWENWSEEEKKTYVKNASLHFGRVKNKEVKKRQLSVWATVHQDLADRIAKEIKWPERPERLKDVKPASEAVKFRAYLGFASKFPGIL